MRILVVDEDRHFAESLARIFQAEKHEVRILRDEEGVNSTVRAGAFDLMLLDIPLRHNDVPTVIRAAREAFGERISIVLLTNADFHDWSGLGPLGADSALSRNSRLPKLAARSELITASRTSTKNLPCTELKATARQLDVLTAMASDLTRKEISRVLALSEARIDEHIRLLKRRLGVRTPAGLILRAVEEGWIGPCLGPKPKS